MPIFEYKGLNRAGKSVRGVVDAENIRAARARLKKDNIFVTDINDKKKIDPSKKKKSISTKSVPIRDMSLMTRQLATLVKANIPLVDALSAVSEQVENPVLSEAIADCKNQVNEGSTLHKSLQKYPDVFSKIYISMVEAGEASGSLDTILLRLAEFTESSAELESKVKSAMTYPVIMLVVTFAIVMGLFTFILPKISAIFEQNPEITLPWYTEVIMAISAVVVEYWWAIFIAIGGVYFFFRSWKNSPEGQKRWDAISLQIPLMGPIVRMVAISRFTRTLATLLTGGVPMLMALDIVRNVVDNDVIATAIDDARGNISEGESIAGPLRKSGQFPPIVIHMVTIGEKTGELENMLTQVSTAYEFQVKSKIDGLTSLIGPVMTVVMGLIVTIIVMAVLVPMFEMTNIAQ